jgi:hypothetical protein
VSRFTSDSGESAEMQSTLRKAWERVGCKAQDNLVPRACDPREGTWGSGTCSGIIRCRKPGSWLR